jgi:diaminohydroxyphosphoribosylaminopyrimidine deaminase/5-amino-6-(5-phosphoribosylamino)uracil reductase
MQDPNPRVAGEGFLRLEKAGISVETGPGAGEALELNRGFASRMRRGRPWVIAKVAASLDGRTAMASGESRWITSAAARDDVQHWRARAGGVLTGIDTVVADDPRLDVRREDLVGRVRQPLRIVADSRLRLPETARLLAGEGGGEVVVFTRSGDDRRVAALEAAGARIERQADDAAPVNLEGMLARIGALGVNELLVEAGRTLTGALAAAALVDEWIVYLAPRLMGDAARGLVRLPGIERLADTPRLEWREVRFVGPDLRLTLRSASGG